MKSLKTEIVEQSTFYAVLDDDCGQLISDNLEADGWYSYEEWPRLGNSLVVQVIENTKLFESKEEATAVRDRMVEKYNSPFSVLTLKKKNLTIYTLE